MTDEEFTEHVVNYVHYYFRNDPLLLEIVAEGVERARVAEREEASDKMLTESIN